MPVCCDRIVNNLVPVSPLGKYIVFFFFLSSLLYQIWKCKIYLNLSWNDDVDLDYYIYIFFYTFVVRSGSGELRGEPILS